MRWSTCSAIGLCLVAGAAANAQSIALNHNWNGMVHDGEQTVPFADDPDGFRAMSDRAMRLGITDALGGESLSLNTAGGSYTFEGGEGVLDQVMIGTRAANGQIGWDLEPDNDQWGIQPNWDPTGGGAVQIDATTDVSVLTDESFQLSFLYNGSVGGGDFEVVLGFADGAEVTLIVNSPDWFANFDPVPPPPLPGVESQEKLPGPLSEGDGFAGTNTTDYALPGEPLAVFEAVITATSLLDGLGFDVAGRELTSVTFDATTLIALSDAAIGIYGLSINDAPVPLDVNWNGAVQGDEVADSLADEPDGYRSIGDRGFFTGDADSLGGEGYSLTSEGRSYDVVSTLNTVDMTMIGTRPGGFDDEVNGDNIGVAPAWDPSKGGGLVIEAITELDNIPLDGTFELGVLYHASNGGGSFDMRLGFADGDDVTVTLNSPDWFANNNPVPPAPNPGVASQATLPGPLSGGDGFFGAAGFDNGVPDLPLSAFEAVVTATSLNDVGFDVNGRELTSITFDAINLLFENPNAAIGIFGASLGGDEVCIGDCDENGQLNVLDFVCFQLEWQAQTAKGDCDGNGQFNILDFVCFQLAWQEGCD